MKATTGLITIIFVLGAFTSVGAQSRIDGLYAEEIYSIRVIQQSNMGYTDERNISAPEDVNRIVNYLKKYDYRDFGLDEIDDVSGNKMAWKYQIIFNGWRDEVYIFDDKVFIGKSAFKLPPGLIREFDRIFRDL